MENILKDAASSDRPNDWHSIDWKLVMQFVGKAQMNIAKAEMVKDFRRVAKLQRSLIRSWQAKALAVRKVTENKGKRTCGTFSKIDNLIYWRLMRWGLRRHPRKTKGWVFAHYWKHWANRYRFTAQGVNRFDEAVTTELYALADTKIERHTKVKGDFNPFDPAWVVYGEQLRVQRMSKDIWDIQRTNLWIEQDGNCALCRQEIDMDNEQYDDHHIVYRQFGGSDALSNRVLLHSVCHKRVHALGLKVIKPVPVRGL